MSREMDAAVKAARAAGKEIMKHFGNLRCVRRKGKDFSLVTEADFAAQNKIKETILGEFPNAVFFAEEDEKHPSPADLVWVVDPLDGTKNFVRGIRLFGVSIALFREGGIALGVIFDPVTEELFSAEKGKGALLNGKPIRVSGVSVMEQSIIDLPLPRRKGVREKNFEFFKKLFERMGSQRQFGSATIHLSYIASGIIDAYVEYGLFPWDVAAGILLVEEAGGKVSNEKGEKFDLFNDKTVVASNGKIHEEIIKELNK